jgi:hypothetical protein
VRGICVYAWLCVCVCVFVFVFVFVFVCVRMPCESCVAASVQSCL